MKRIIFAFLVAIVSFTLADGQAADAPIGSAYLSDLRERPEFYAGRLVELRCMIFDDEFETRWLMDSLKILDHPPIRYSLSSAALRDEAGIALLRGAMKGRLALVTVHGRLRVHPNALEPWRLEFVIDRVVAASSVKRPNQALQPTRMLVTFCAYAQPAPSTRVADL